MFQMGGMFETFYDFRDGGFGFTIPFEMDATEAQDMVVSSAGFPIGFGIAETSDGTERTLVLGIGFQMRFSNMRDGDVNVSQFGWSSFDADTRAKLCTKWLPGVTGSGFEIEPGISGVANYLSAGGRGTEVEIRILREKESPFERRRTEFYDPRTWALISMATESAPGI